VPEPGRVLELARGVLEAEVEELLAGRAHELDQLVVGHVVHLAGVHVPLCAPSRATNLVFTGSLCPASRMASPASGPGTPARSNITRPGFTSATQPSGDPLPEPLRVPAGFCLTGL